MQGASFFIYLKAVLCYTNAEKLTTKDQHIMKRLTILFGCVFLLFSGCQEPSHSKSGCSKFPPSLAGTWKAQGSKWQVTLAPDGKVVSLVNAIGSSMVIAEGEMFFEEGPKKGTFLRFVFGPCFTNYNLATRELGVTVTMKDFYMQLPDKVLEEDMKYRITGPVSEDSNRWDAKLFVYITPKGGQPTDPNLVEPKVLVFDKVEDVQPSPPENQ